MDPLRQLEPLPYHRQIAALLKQSEPQIWAWGEAQRCNPEAERETRSSMLRNTYRLEAEAHPKIHARCASAMQALGIEAPATLYQAADGSMNAALCYIPGQIHLIFYGPILEKLSDPELLALMGHELAHYKLWSIEDGGHHVASRLFDHALAYPDAAPSHAETARLLGLHTELYADRGAALAAGECGPAISLLVKTMTGLASVDPVAYLRQAQELDLEAERSQGSSHPEHFLRAQALDKWWRGDADTDAWIDSRLSGAWTMAALDLPRQRRLTAVTRSFLARFLARPEASSEAVLAQARRYFPDFAPDGAGGEDLAVFYQDIDDSVRDYLIALVFDAAMADPDRKDDLLLAGARAALDFDGIDRYRTALKRDLKLTKPAIDRMIARLGKAA